VPQLPPGPLPAAAVTHPQVTFLRYAIAVVTEGTSMAYAFTSQAQATWDVAKLYDLIWLAYAYNYFPAPPGSPREAALAAVFDDSLAYDYLRPDAAARLYARCNLLINGAIGQIQWRMMQQAKLSMLAGDKDALAVFAHDLYQAHALTLSV